VKRYAAGLAALAELDLHEPMRLGTVVPMPARFFNPVLLSNGDLKVSGPFSNGAGKVLGDVQIRYLIIPDSKEERDPPGTIDPAAKPPRIIDRVATVPPGGDSFEDIVPAADVPPLRRGDLVRGIGLAVAIKHFPPGPSEPHAPPAFETLTWCVDLKIEVETAD
jgi:hypothetical protein